MGKAHLALQHFPEVSCWFLGPWDLVLFCFWWVKGKKFHSLPHLLFSHWNSGFFFYFCSLGFTGKFPFNLQQQANVGTEKNCLFWEFRHLCLHKFYFSHLLRAVAPKTFGIWMGYHWYLLPIYIWNWEPFSPPPQVQAVLWEDAADWSPEGKPLQR